MTVKYNAIVSELINAISALNMEPEAIENPEGPFLADRDYWAAHAVEHINAAIDLLLGDN